MQAKKIYKYKGRDITLKGIAELIGTSNTPVNNHVAHLPVGSDVTEFVDTYRNADARSRILYEGRMLTRKEIAEQTGLAIMTVYNVVRGARMGDDVTARVKESIKNRNTRYKKYLVNGEYLSAAEISFKYGITKSTLFNRLYTSGYVEGSDISGIIEDATHNRTIPYLVNGEKLMPVQICEKYSISYDVLWQRLRKAGLHRGDEISSVLYTTAYPTNAKVAEYLRSVTGDDSVGGTGVRLSYRNLVRYLNAGVYAAVRRFDVSFLEQYNYDGRRTLGFEKACRSTWLVDDLWEYTCPVCGKRLVLTTEQIVAHEHGDMCGNNVEDLLDNAEVT